VKYFWITIKHKWFVLQAAHRVGLSFCQALMHDLSKFTSAELPHYDRQFFGDKGDAPGFARAWLHHQNCNPHHWEYWITRSDHSRGASGAVDGCLPMPERYIKEMIVDWFAAGRAYTGSWDIEEWVNGHIDNMRLHPETRERVKTMLWYAGVVVGPHKEIKLYG